jgi:homoserine dehydrogenase
VTPGAPTLEERRRLELIYVGFGNVGRRVSTLLEEMRDRLPFAARTVAIVTGHHGAIAPDGEPAALPQPSRDGGSNAHVITALAEHHADAAREGRLVCIETSVLDIRHGEPAISHVRAALAGAAHVVTANKGPIAFAYAELAAMAQRVDRRFLFEGIVMDGIPVFNLIRETLPGIRVERFRGIVNSTTNHILTMMERGGTFEAALAEMQVAGIAEADPTLDVDGWDAAAKTAALMNVLMDAAVTPHDIARQGIRDVSQADVASAHARGERLRLVASAEAGDGPVRGRVRMERVLATDPLGSLDGQQNALLLGTDLLGEIGVLQRDGGLTQTAYAIVTDLTTIARRLDRRSLRAAPVRQNP